MKKILSFFILFCLIFSSVYADNTDASSKLLTEANQYYLKKDYKETIEKYEAFIALWWELTNPNDIWNLLSSYVYEWKFKEWLSIIYFLISVSWKQEWIVWSYIEKDNISDDIDKVVDEIDKTKRKDPKLLIDYAKLLYKAWDYYYEEDQNKYYFAILFHYLTAYVILDEALALDKKNSEIYFYQWRLFMDINWDNAKAQKKLITAIKLKRDNFEYYYRLWNSFYDQWKYDIARQLYLIWIKLNGNFEKLYLNLWNTYFKQLKKAFWFQAYQKWLAICSEMCDWFNYNLWNEYYNNWDFQKAISYYESALKINPEHKSAKIMLIEAKKYLKK